MGNWTANGVQLRSPNGHQSRRAICSDGSGGIYAAFRSDAQLLAQHVGPTGDLLWNWDGIAVKNVAGNVGRPVVVPTGNGEVIIAWADYRTGDWDIYAQRLTWTGSVASGWDPGGVRLTFLTKDETNPVAVSDAQGGAIVTWELEYGIGDLDIYASRVTASGTVASGWPPFGSWAWPPDPTSRTPCP